MLLQLLLNFNFLRQYFLWGLGVPVVCVFIKAVVGSLSCCTHSPRNQILCSTRAFTAGIMRGVDRFEVFSMRFFSRDF